MRARHHVELLIGFHGNVEEEGWESKAELDLCLRHTDGIKEWAKMLTALDVYLKAIIDG